MANKPTRRVEYYRLWLHGSDCGTWDTDFIEIPVDAPEDKLDEAVRDAAAQIDWVDDPPAIVGVYHVPVVEDDDAGGGSY